MAMKEQNAAWRSLFLLKQLAAKAEVVMVGEWGDWNV